MSVVINARCLQCHTTGVQRYLQEIVKRFPVDEYRTVTAPNTQSGELGHLWEQVRLPMLVKGDLLWSPSNNGPWLTRKQVLTLHDIVPIEHPEWVNKKLSAWLQFLLPKLAKVVQQILTVSDFSKQRIVDRLNVSPDKVTVIYNGVDARFNPSSAIRRPELEQSFPQLPQKYILSVGSIEPRKNIRRLFSSWRSVLEDIPDDFYLVVAGKLGRGRIFGNVELPRVPERVVELGYVPDDLLATLYANALGFAYLSEYEGFGLPALEALATGVVPLTSNTTSLPEVVGEAGILVDPLDEEAIADGLRRLIANGSEIQNMRSKTLVQAEKFSWEKAAEQTWSLLQRESLKSK